MAHQLDAATSGLLASQSQLIGDANPGLSKLLSVAAWRLNSSSAARHAMLAAAARPGIAVLFATGSVNSVAFSPDGKTLAAGSHGTVLLWDVATHQGTAALAGTAEQINAVAFSPDGKTLADGVADGMVVLWNAVTHPAIGGRLIDGHAGVNSVAFSPDGKTLAAGSNDGGVRLWDLATRRPIGGVLSGQSGPVTAVAFSPDGMTLAVGNDGGSGTVWVWDMAAHQQIGTALITGQGGPVSSVAFSPDGKTLALGSYDGSVWLRGVATRQQGRPVTASGFPVDSVAFSPDGKTLASGSIDGTVRLWNVATPSHSLAQTANLVRYLCALAGRPLTRAEWARYVPHLPYQPVCA